MQEVCGVQPRGSLLAVSPYLLDDLRHLFHTVTRRFYRWAKRLDVSLAKTLGSCIIPEIGRFIPGDTELLIGHLELASSSTHVEPSELEASWSASSSPFDDLEVPPDWVVGFVCTYCSKARNIRSSSATATGT